MKFFFSRESSTIEQRASEQRLAIETLQTRQAEAALEAVLSGNYYIVDDIAAQLRQANEKLKVLTLAEEAVQAKEQAAENEAKAKEAASRRRALSQHLSRLQRAAADYESATSQAVAAFRSMVDAGQAALQQVGGRVEMYNELSVAKLLQLAEVEIRRQGSKATHLGDMPCSPGASSAAIGGTPVQQLEPLSKAVARISKWTTERFAVTSSKPTVKPKAVVAEATTSFVATDGPKDRMEPTEPATPQSEGQAQPPAAVPVEPSSLAADPAEASAFKKLESLSPHREGSPEAQGFASALREMHSRKGDRA